jgi:hypothetical protein
MTDQEVAAADDKPVELQKFLEEVIEEKEGFSLGEPWKYSEDALAVVVPILRPDAPDREYVTMYEVLKELGIKDTGEIERIELQNRAGKPVFVRAGTIFTGGTQSRASQNSVVFQPGKNDVNVRCVHQTHGIRGGADMKFGDIAPPSVTEKLMSKADQGEVWRSVHRFTGQIRDIQDHMDVEENFIGYMQTDDTRYPSPPPRPRGGRNVMGLKTRMTLGETTNKRAPTPRLRRIRSDDLLGHLKQRDEGKTLLDDMMQRVPLFENQVGAIIFNPVGVVAVEIFDHEKSWAAIKKEIIEKHGDKIMEEQANHLFELKPDRIIPALKKFVDKLADYKEENIYKDGFSETRIIVGDGIVGEYTIVLGKVIHALLTRTEKR